MPVITRVDAFLWYFPRFRTGQTVQATIWDGKITALAGDGDAFVTTSSPLFGGLELRWTGALIGLAGTLPLLVGVVHALWKNTLHLFSAFLG